MTFRQFALTSLLSSLMALPLGAQNAITRSLFDPDLYPAVNGGFDLILQSGDTLAIDTSALTITRNGASLGTGVVGNTAGPIPQAVALFTFTNLTIPTGVTVTLTGTRPLGLLARRDMSIGSSLSVRGLSGQFYGSATHDGGAGKCGGGSGGAAGWVTAAAGSGPGGGNGVTNNDYAGGGAGGFGGPGQFAIAPGGSTYGSADLADLFGGSGGGGGTGYYTSVSSNAYGGSGGGGGGALCLIAQRNLTITSSIDARGGEGGDGSYSQSYGHGGGGSGGAVLLAAPSLSLTGTVTADGEPGGYATSAYPYNGISYAGAGGGGRIAAYYRDSSPPNTGYLSIDRRNYTQLYNPGGGYYSTTSIYTPSGTIYRSTVDEPAFVFPAALTVPAEGSPGLPESTFSGDGLQLTAFPGAAEARGVAVQPDGKTVAVGYAATAGGNQDVALTRYLPDGALDATFGSGGQVTTAVGPGGDFGRAVALQSDGKILVAGFTSNASGNTDCLLLRYHGDAATGTPGTLDASFGSGGVVITAFGASNDYAYGVAVQNDGKILVTGGATFGHTDDLILARYDASGALDSTFDGDGKVSLAFGVGTDEGRAVKVQADGKIVVAGYASSTVSLDFALARFLPNGSLDGTFGSAGKVLTDFFGIASDAANGLAIQDDGKIILAGYANTGAGNYDFAVARYTTNGALDTTFDGDGKATASIGAYIELGTSVVVQTDGKLVVAGHTQNASGNDMAVLRFNADGSLDGTFDGDGKVVLAPGPASDELHSVALAPDGDIVAAGSSMNGSGTPQFAVVRLLGLPDPPPDIQVEMPAGMVLVDGTGSVNTGSVMVLTDGTPATVTVRNNGGLPLTGLSVSVTGIHPGDFLLNTAGLPSSLPAGGSATFTVTLRPAAEGARLAQIQIASNDPDENPFDIALAGTGVGVPEIQVERSGGFLLMDGAALLFGTVDTQAPPVHYSLVIRNTGTGTLSEVQASLMGSPHFQIQSPPPGSIPPGGTGSMIVSFDPALGSSGNHSAQLQILSDDADERPFDITLAGQAIHPDIYVRIVGGELYAHNFGAIAAMDSAVATVRVENMGQTVLQSTGPMSISGSHAADFTLSGTVFILDVGQYQDFTVTFTPSAPGLRSASLFIPTNDYDDPVRGIQLTGTGVFDPEIEVFAGPDTGVPELTDGQTEAVNFGSVEKGGPGATRTFTLRNTGDAALSGLSVVTGGTHAGEYLVSSPLVSVLPGQTASFTVTFQPAGAGERPATLQIASNDPDENPFDIPLTGFGIVEPEIEVDYPRGMSLASGTGSVDFGSTAEGVAALAHITLRNSGSGPLLLTDASVTGTGFSLVAPPAFPVTLAPGGMQAFAVRLYAATCLEAAGTLTILSDDADEGTFTVALTGMVAPSGTNSIPVIWGLQQWDGRAFQGQKFLQLAAGSGHNVGLRADGVVVGWGESGSGQTTVPGTLANLKALAAGTLHNLALRHDGTVAAWGWNGSGQISVPAGLSGVSAVAAAGNFSVALKVDGTVVAWGDNSSGQTTVPAGLTGVTAIAAGGSHTVALKSDGSVEAWGSNANGQSTPPAGLGGVIAIAAGGTHTMALKSDGTVVAWGSNALGQSTVPAGLTGVQAIAAGGNHSVALKADGTVVAWGSNNHGQSTVPAGLAGVQAITAGGSHTLALFSDGSFTAWGLNSTSQAVIPGALTGLVSIAAGGSHFVGLRSDGTVAAWGGNANGQITVPAGLTGIVRVAAGVNHSVALRADGTVAAWGANGNGQITVPAGLTGVTAIAAGDSHTVALKSDGSVVAWGANGNGQSTVPAGLSGVTAIAAGGNHTVALLTDGTVAAWGDNAGGQSTVPAGLGGITAIAAGGYHTAAIRNDGTVVSWGTNGSGQLNIPAGLTGVQAIAAGFAHTVALKADGSVIGWGYLTAPADITSTTSITARGLYSAALVQASGLPVANPQEIAVHLGMDAEGPELLDGQTAPVDFGSTLPGVAALRAFTVTNDCVGPLEITGFNLPAGFTLMAGGPAFPLTLRGGETATWQVGMQSTEPEALGGTMEILSNDPDEAVFTILLSGFIASPPDVSVLAASAITATSVRLHGTVDANGDPATAVFEAATMEGPFTPVASVPAEESPVSGVSPVSVNATLTGLMPHTTYRYRLAAGNGAGTTQSGILTFTTLNTNPVTVNQSLTTPEDSALMVTLTDSDADGDVLTYTLYTAPSHGQLSGTYPNLTYTPDANYYGPDSFVYFVNDGFVSVSGEITIAVTPENDTPGAESEELSTDEDTAVNIELTGEDIETETLEYQILTMPAHGTLSGAVPNVTYTPDANWHGTDSFTFAASDGAATSPPASVVITVQPVNDAPQVSGRSVGTAEDTPVTFTSEAVDVDGDALTFSITVPPQHGTAAVTEGEFTYTPGENYNGPDSLTFEVTDGEFSASAVVVLNVTSVNDAPVTSFDVLSVNEDTTLTVGSSKRVLLNDSDLHDGAPAEGNSPLAALLVQAPAHAQSFTLNANGTFTYTPKPNFHGLDGFTYRAVDALGAESEPETVLIAVWAVNDAPMAAPQELETLEDVPIPVRLRSADPDLLITFDPNVWLGIPPPNNGPAPHDADPIYTLVTAPQHGTLSGDGAQWIYTPNADFHGQDSFTFTASDGMATSNTATVTITVQPDSDGDALPDAWEISELGALTWDGTSDPDGDGQDNTFELIAGNNPADSNSCLCMEPASTTPDGGAFRLNHVRSGVLYRLESSMDLSAWDTLSEVTYDVEGPGAIYDPRAQGALRRFYRVTVERFAGE